MKGKKILRESDVKHIERLLSTGLNPVEIAEIIGTSRSTVMRVKSGTHFLLRKNEEKPVEEKTVEETPDTVERKEVTLQDVIKNQEIIIQLLRQYLAEWRIS